MLNLTQLTNPIWERSDNLRDPAVLPLDDGYLLFYSRYSNRDWGKDENWAIAAVFTPDFVTFENDRDISPKGFASPGDPLNWHGRIILPYQSYPRNPARLCFSESHDGKTWSLPRFFLSEANQLPWNPRNRVIDPSLVIHNDTLHCFFVGSKEIPTSPATIGHANLLGHALTRDPSLEHWTILTPDEPILGISNDAPDGVENVMVIRTDGVWTMVYSEGLKNQHLAYAHSPDLIHWTRQGEINIQVQSWMSVKYGAPFIWREPEQWVMILMGENPGGRTSFGLLTSPDGFAWTPLPERI